MALTVSQISQLAYNAGFRGPALTMAVAVAIAESSGNPQAYNPEKAAGTRAGLGSYGLWQIYRQAHPEFSSWNLYDPQTNAKAAYAVYRAAGNRFTPWSTYNNGSAKKIANGLTGISGGSSGGYEIQTTGTAVGVRGSSSGSSQGSAVGTLVNVNVPPILPSNITDFLSSPKVGTRIMFGFIGVILLVIGLSMLASSVGKSATEGVQNYAVLNVKGAKKVAPLTEVSQ